MFLPLSRSLKIAYEGEIVPLLHHFPRIIFYKNIRLLISKNPIVIRYKTYNII